MLPLGHITLPCWPDMASIWVMKHWHPLDHDPNMMLNLNGRSDRQHAGHKLHTSGALIAVAVSVRDEASPPAMVWCGLYCPKTEASGFCRCSEDFPSFCLPGHALACCSTTSHDSRHNDDLHGPSEVSMHQGMDSIQTRKHYSSLRLASKWSRDPAHDGLLYTKPVLYSLLTLDRPPSTQPDQKRSHDYVVRPSPARWSGCIGYKDCQGELCTTSRCTSCYCCGRTTVSRIS